MLSLAVGIALTIFGVLLIGDFGKIATRIYDFFRLIHGSRTCHGWHLPLGGRVRYPGGRNVDSRIAPS